MFSRILDGVPEIPKPFRYDLVWCAVNLMYGLDLNIGNDEQEIVKEFIIGLAFFRYTESYEKHTFRKIEIFSAIAQKCLARTYRWMVQLDVL